MLLAETRRVKICLQNYQIVLNKILIPDWLKGSFNLNDNDCICLNNFANKETYCAMLDPGHVSPGSKKPLDFGNSPVSKKLRIAKREALKTYACSNGENHSIRILGNFVAAEVRKGTPAYVAVTREGIFPNWNHDAKTCGDTPILYLMQVEGLYTVGEQERGDGSVTYDGGDMSWKYTDRQVLLFDELVRGLSDNEAMDLFIVFPMTRRVEQMFVNSLATVGHNQQHPELCMDHERNEEASNVCPAAAELIGFGNSTFRRAMGTTNRYALGTVHSFLTYIRTVAYRLWNSSTIDGIFWKCSTERSKDANFLGLEQQLHGMKGGGNKKTQIELDTLKHALVETFERSLSKGLKPGTGEADRAIQNSILETAFLNVFCNAADRTQAILRSTVRNVTIMCEFLDDTGGCISVIVEVREGTKFGANMDGGVGDGRNPMQGNMQGPHRTIIEGATEWALASKYLVENKAGYSDKYKNVFIANASVPLSQSQYLTPVGYESIAYDGETEAVTEHRRLRQSAAQSVEFRDAEWNDLVRVAHDTVHDATHVLRYEMYEQEAVALNGAMGLLRQLCQLGALVTNNDYDVFRLVSNFVGRKKDSFASVEAANEVLEATRQGLSLLSGVANDNLLLFPMNSNLDPMRYMVWVVILNIWP